MDENLPKEKTYGKTGDTTAPQIPVLNTSGIIDCTFLMPPQEDGQHFRVRIIKIIGDHEKKVSQDPGNTQFICSVGYYQ